MSGFAIDLDADQATQQQQAFNAGYADGRSGAASAALERVGFGWSTTYDAGYAEGVKAGPEPSDGHPSVVPDLGGVPLEEYEREGREILESLTHEHMPHTEVESEVPPPPPQTSGQTYP